MYKPARMGNGIEIWGVRSFSKIQIETEQVIDFLGMMGDWQHPGLPGVGEVTKKFLKNTDPWRIF
jgi:DNA polymerase-1